MAFECDWRRIRAFAYAGGAWTLIACLAACSQSPHLARPALAPAAPASAATEALPTVTISAPRRPAAHWAAAGAEDKVAADARRAGRGRERLVR
jgi:hypothetical protein